VCRLVIFSVEIGINALPFGAGKNSWRLSATMNSKLEPGLTSYWRRYGLDCHSKQKPKCIYPLALLAGKLVEDQRPSRAPRIMEMKRINEDS
jgi:hypothetical protein